MEKEPKYGQMDQDTMVSGEMTGQMALEDLYMLMGMYTKETGKMTKLTVGANICI